MKKLLLIYILSISIIGLTSCTKKVENLVPLENTETSIENIVKDKEYDIFIFNSKGENATEFENMAKIYQEETGVKVKTVSIGSGQDHMATLREEMNSDNMPTIFSIQGIKELTEWKQGGFALDFNDIPDGEFKKFANGINEDLRLTTNGISNYGVPYNVEGYGYIVDKQMLIDIFDDINVDTLINDIKYASYEEWNDLIIRTDSYIKTGVARPVSLNGNSYLFKETKSGLALNLTGVFAVMGSQKWTYGDHFINVALNTKFDSAFSAFNATDDQINDIKDAMIVYAKALDTKTSYMAGESGPLVRGMEFINEEITGYDQTVKIFAQSKAVFFKHGNWAYTNIESVNNEVSKRLVFVPVKMPMTEDIIKVEGLTVDKFNSSIPVFVPNYYSINALVSEEERVMAMDFLLWLNNSEKGNTIVKNDFNFIPFNADPDTTVLNSSLGNSIISYMKSGNTLEAPYNGAPAPWSGDIVGLYLLENYMVKEKWEDESYKDIAQYCVDQWLLNK